jgi:hypothetical protein
MLSIADTAHVAVRLYTSESACMLSAVCLAGTETEDQLWGKFKTNSLFSSFNVRIVLHTGRRAALDFDCQPCTIRVDEK